ncbi:HU family DNA-binding protein [Psittacicella gerlachiana]|uniref:DNA-binding protein n=1 Tax=Psittacicella gerlachiana TaxID=2028574 RepID=A0A3A1XZ51_9GAMM|nr:HU family DNA-binding protein [Psittacicella gerlachiana]RIY31302.1 hypothetical protein CKF59_07740 [Psittacicella gerlachiana]
MSKEDLEVNETTVDSLLTVKELLGLLKANLKNSDNPALNKLGGSEALARELLDAWSETLQEALVSGRKVRVNGLGVFATKYRPERNFTNPLTGKPGHAPAHVNVAFTTAKTLKEAVGNDTKLVQAHKKALQNKGKK